MFCEPKGQELNTIVCSIFLEIFLNPWEPLACVYVDLKKIRLAVCRSSLTHLRKETQYHFKCIKKYKITPRSCCLSAIMLCSILGWGLFYIVNVVLHYFK